MRRKIDGVEIKTSKKTFTSANIIRAEVGTNGYRGGDSGHGSRTFISIKDLSGTNIDVKTLKDGGFEVRLGGDTELLTMIDALRWIVKKLEKGACKCE